MTIEQLKERIDELIREREALLQDANRQIAFINGQMAALQALIDEMQAPPGEPDER